MKKLLNFIKALFKKREYIDIAKMKLLQSRGITPLFYNDNKIKLSLKSLIKTKDLKTIKS